MTVFVKALSDLIALLLQALRLSVLLPASVIVGLNLAFVLPLFAETRLYHTIGPDDSDFPLTIVALISVLLVAYGLSAANIPIIRFFEGFSWLDSPLGKFKRYVNARRINHIRRLIEKLDNDSYEFSNQADQTQDKAIADKLNRKAHWCEFERNVLNANLVLRYPQNQPWRVLPTRLGNVIAAAEEYPGHLYGIDAVTFWPFLVPILTEEGYAPFVEREKATLDFLLNMAVVTLAFGAELVYVDWLLSQVHIVSVALKLLLTGTIAFCFYLLAIQGALSWGYTIRTSFVFYRHRLRKRLGLRQPTGFHNEYSMWGRASRFYRDHDITPGREILDYSSFDETQASQARQS